MVVQCHACFEVKNRFTMMFTVYTQRASSEDFSWIVEQLERPSARCLDRHCHTRAQPPPHTAG